MVIVRANIAFLLVAISALAWGCDCILAWHVSTWWLLVTRRRVALGTQVCQCTSLSPWPSQGMSPWISSGMLQLASLSNQCTHRGIVTDGSVTDSAASTNIGSQLFGMCTQRAASGNSSSSSGRSGSGNWQAACGDAFGHSMMDQQLYRLMSSRTSGTGSGKYYEINNNN